MGGKVYVHTADHMYVAPHKLFELCYVTFIGHSLLGLIGIPYVLFLLFKTFLAFLLPLRNVVCRTLYNIGLAFDISTSLYPVIIILPCDMVNYVVLFPLVCFYTRY